MSQWSQRRTFCKRESINLNVGNWRSFDRSKRSLEAINRSDSKCRRHTGRKKSISIQYMRSKKRPDEDCVLYVLVTIKTCRQQPLVYRTGIERFLWRRKQTCNMCRGLSIVIRVLVEWKFLWKWVRQQPSASLTWNIFLYIKYSIFNLCLENEKFFFFGNGSAGALLYPCTSNQHTEFANSRHHRKLQACHTALILEGANYKAECTRVGRTFSLSHSPNSLLIYDPR